MSEKAKVPDYDTDRQAIDIFVFSNGQQYSPPRKYHLRLTDLNLWKSTLKYLAETQYGPSTANSVLDYPESFPGHAVESFFQFEEILIQRHSSVDLYTLEGNKLVGPLELSNGTSYVAVAPQDIFIDAGYDKYLIRATRSNISWEKRQASKTENVIEKEEPGNNGMVIETEKIDVRVQDSNLNLKPLNDSTILKTVVSSMVNNDTSLITKPRLSLGSQRKPDSFLVGTGTVKPIEKKKLPIQRSSFNRKIALPSPPTPNLKPSFKKNDVTKTVIGKKTRPEVENHSSPNSTGNQVNKLVVKSNMIKPMTKPKEPRSQGALSKVQEVASELKSSSAMKIINTNNGKLTNNVVDLKSISEDKEMVLVSKLFQNSHRELPSIALTPMSNHHELIKQQAMTAIDKNDGQVQESLHFNSENESGVPISNIINNCFKDEENIYLGKEIKENRNENIMREKLLIEYPTYPTHTIIHKVEENTRLNNEVTIIDTKSNENITIQDSSPQKHLITPKHLPNQNATSKIEGNLNLNELIISTSESNKAISFYSSEPLRSSMIASKVFVDEYKKQKVEEGHGQNLTTTETPTNDQYVVKVLKKSEVVSIKLNIEIENRDDRDRLTIHPKENIITHSMTNTYTEKGSQINIDEQLVTQNKSLLSLIVKEVNDLNITNNHHLIIIQCSGCKFCNERNNAMQDKPSENNEKVEEKNEGCNSSQPRPDIRFSSLPNPVETTCSCISQQRMARPNQSEITKEDTSQNMCAPDQNTTLNIVEDVSVSRKKSVAISEDSAPNTRELSKISQEVVTKSQLYAVSVESIRVLPKTTVHNSTQTEWCDVLLEARVHDGGHYTFRLPTIELLKLYKLT